MRCRLFLLTLMISLFLSGCNGGVGFSDDDLGIYEKIHHYYSKMESYSARVRLTVRSNKTDNVYELEQSVKGSDKALSRILSPDSIKGLETVRNGDKVTVRFGDSDKNELAVEASEDIDLSYVSNFFSLYYRSEETAVSVSSREENAGTTLLETDLPAESARRQKASMLVDNRTLAPKNITVYDMGGNVVFIAEFIEFVYNDKVEDKIFDITG